MTKLTDGKNFNPRSRVGSDPIVPDNNNRFSVISIHAPAWGATGDEEDKCLRRIFQSTLPRGERLQQLFDLFLFFRISIHAPAWGATGLLLLICQTVNISIHAPAWGATVECK